MSKKDDARKVGVVISLAKLIRANIATPEDILKYSHIVSLLTDKEFCIHQDAFLMFDQQLKNHDGRMRR